MHIVMFPLAFLNADHFCPWHLLLGNPTCRSDLGSGGPGISDISCSLMLVAVALGRTPTVPPEFHLGELH